MIETQNSTNCRKENVLVTSTISEIVLSILCFIQVSSVTIALILNIQYTKGYLVFTIAQSQSSAGTNNF